MDYNSREDSDSIAAIEGDKDIDDSFSTGSDVEIHDIAPKPAVAPSNKKSIAPSASHTSAKAPQAQSDPWKTIQWMKMRMTMVSVCPFSHIYFSAHSKWQNLFRWPLRLKIEPRAASWSSLCYLQSPGMTFSKRSPKNSISSHQSWNYNIVSVTKPVITSIQFEVPCSICINV